MRSMTSVPFADVTVLPWDHVPLGWVQAMKPSRLLVVELVSRIQIVLEAHPTGEGARDHHALTAAGKVVRDVVTKAGGRQGPAGALHAFFGDRGGQPEADREQANHEQGDATHVLH